MGGLEQRYGVERRGSRERKIYEKLNEIGKGEAYLLAQAVDQMKGHQYSNIQHRVYLTVRYGNFLKDGKTLRRIPIR